jgi:hypothetical protein
MRVGVTIAGYNNRPFAERFARTLPATMTTTTMTTTRMDGNGVKIALWLEATAKLSNRRSTRPSHFH